MKSHRAGDGERILAVFIDFENLALGFGNRRDRFTIEKVLERLVEKGKIVAKKAYADWSRFGNYAASLHQSAVELVEIPKRTQTGKNSADIRMVVDAMDLAYSKDHIDTFVVVSGDSDFSPLVSKLKELGKHVIGLGLSESTSDLLRDNCDEFIYYEDLDRAALTPITDNPAIPEVKRKAFNLLVDSLLALRRENKEVIFSSMVKDTMKRKKPSFNEEYHGYRTFTELLEDAQRNGLLELERHKTSGTYVVTRFGGEPKNGNAIGVPPRIVTLPPARPVLPPALRPAAPPPPEPVVRPVLRVNPPPPVEPRRPVVEPVEPRRQPPPRPVEPPPTPASRSREVDDIPLGRALMDDIDDLDDVPSYMPRKGSEPPAGRPAKPVRVEPKPAGELAPTRRAAEPAKPKAPASRRVEKPAPPAEPAVVKAAPRTRVAPAAKPAVKPVPVPKPVAKAQPVDDNSFGAGLDD